jgi:hypothetical protein
LNYQKIISKIILLWSSVIFILTCQGREEQHPAK